MAFIFWDLWLWSCCYMTWNFELPCLKWLSHRLVYSSFQCIFQYRHKKPKQNFKFCNGTPPLFTDVAKLLTQFLVWKVCHRLELNFCTCSLERGFYLNWFCLFVLFIQDVRFIYSFSQQIQLNKLLRICTTKLLYIWSDRS